MSGQPVPDNICFIGDIIDQEMSANLDSDWFTLAELALQFVYADVEAKPSNSTGSELIPQELKDTIDSIFSIEQVASVSFESDS